ncbi:MAG: hypothetical protein MJZ75_02850 [Paludibacteraceae bacterium]|nr:hypothetical protein [Paludibacteraceae bacterium]
MKKYLFYTMSAIIALALCSCEDKTKVDSQKLLAWQKQVSHFLGESVYQIGDEISMLNKLGEEEIFQVAEVEDQIITTVSKQTLANRNNTWVDEVSICLRLNSPVNEVYVQILKLSEWWARSEEELDSLKHVYGCVVMNDEIENTTLIVNDFDATQPTISITGKSGIIATFRKNEGLQQLTDTLGHIWIRK